MSCLCFFNARCTLPVLWTQLCRDYRTGYTVGLAIKCNCQKLVVLTIVSAKAQALTLLSFGDFEREGEKVRDLFLEIFILHS